jgi:O-antigen/teichoic acid export membrane protein
MNKRVYMNALGYGYAQVVTIAVQLLLIPLFLACWGTVQYSEWIVLTGIPLMLSLIEPGVSQASATRATLLTARGDVEGASRSIQTSLAYSFAICFVIELLCIAVGFMPNLGDKLKIRLLDSDDIRLVIAFTSAHLCTQIVGGNVDAAFRANDRTAIGAFLLANRRAIDGLVSVAVLTQGFGAVVLAAAMFGAQAVYLCALVIYANRQAGAKLGFRAASFAELRTVWRPAVSYLGFPIASLVSLQSGVQIINQLATPEEVVRYTMVRTLMRMIIQIGIVIGQASRPELSRLIGAGKADDAITLNRRAGQASMLAASLLFIVLLALGPTILNIWSAGAVKARTSDVFLIGIHAVLYVFWFMPASLDMAKNEHARAATAYALGAIGGVAIWLATAEYFMPIEGAAIALTVPELVMSIFVLFRMRTRRFA